MKLEIALAERDAALACLRDVMRLLRHTAGSPEESRVWAQARGLLAAAGIEHAEAAQYQAAYEEWERRVKEREARRGCTHAVTEPDPEIPERARCTSCGARFWR